MSEVEVCVGTSLCGAMNGPMYLTKLFRIVYLIYIHDTYIQPPKSLMGDEAIYNIIRVPLDSVSQWCILRRRRRSYVEESYSSC